MQVRPEHEHGWLQRLVGEWTYEMDESTGADGPPTRHEGTDSVRSLGGLWVVCEARGTMPDGTPSTTIMSLGYDPTRRRYVGTFIGSMMTDLWIYDGALDATGEALVLGTEGPDHAGNGRATYRDVVRFDGDDRRTLTSSTLGADGRWTEFFTMSYRRVGTS